uniref:Peroxin-1 n=1 Tax=Syphacia muris TaxID=451379 RepID=A0A0N5AA15_9BILA
MVTFPATLLFKDLYSCFGYLNNVSDSHHAFQQNFYQVSGIYRVTSLKCNSFFLLCVRQNLVCNIGEATKFLWIDTVFGHLQGFRNGEQVIMEKVEVYSRCSAVILRPNEFHDWIEINKQAEFIENNLLNQLQFVNECSSYPIFLNDKLLCCVTVEKTETDSCYSYGILNQHTKLVINPVTNDSLTSENANEHSVVDQLAVVLNNLSTRIKNFFESQTYFSDLNKFLVSPHETSGEKTLRILPRNFINRKISNCALHPTAIFITSEDALNDADIRIVTMRDKAGEHSSYAVLFHLSEYNQSFRQIYDVLRRCKNHCFLSENIMNDAFSDFTWIDYSFVETENIERCYKVLCFLKSADVTVDYTESICDFFIQRCSYYPVVLSKEGFTAEIHCSGRKLSCRFVPYCSDDPTFKCYIFSCGLLPDFEMIYDESEISSQKKTGRPVEELNVKYYKTPSEAFSDDFNLLYQERCLVECTQLVTHLINNIGNMSSHVILKGPKLSGKTTIVKKLVRNLLMSSTPVYAGWIDCVEWQGRSTDFIEKQVSTVSKRLASRRPSILVLDGIDCGLVRKNGSTPDMKSRKTFSAIRRITEEYRIIVVATTEEFDCFMDKAFGSNGNRFFFRKLVILDLESNLICIVLFDIQHFNS